MDMENIDRANWGADAVENGTPDYRHNDFRTNAEDAIANILHAVVNRDEDVHADEGYTEAVRALIEVTLAKAVMHASEELDEPVTGIAVTI